MLVFLLKVGDYIADCKGELIFNLEADRKVDANKWGYMIHVSTILAEDENVRQVKQIVAPMYLIL